MHSQGAYHLEEENFVFSVYVLLLWASLVAQTVKNLLPMQETWARSLGREDPLEKGMAAHSSIPAWRIPWTEEPGGLQSLGLPRVRHNLVTQQQQQQFIK